jgi:hypothetical protein
VANGKQYVNGLGYRAQNVDAKCKPDVAQKLLQIRLFTKATFAFSDVVATRRPCGPKQT